MQCPFCQRAMRSLDNTPSLPRLSMLWICDQCPHEVRIISERKTHEVDAEWETRRLSIFVFHRDQEYCLHWNFMDHTFSVIDPLSDGHIFSTSIMPTTITPDNALDKLKLYLLFL